MHIFPLPRKLQAGRVVLELAYRHAPLGRQRHLADRPTKLLGAWTLSGSNKGLGHPPTFTAYRALAGPATYPHPPTMPQGVWGTLLECLNTYQGRSC